MATNPVVLAPRGGEEGLLPWPRTGVGGRSAIGDHRSWTQEANHASTRQPWGIWAGFTLVGRHGRRLVTKARRWSGGASQAEAEQCDRSDRHLARRPLSLHSLGRSSRRAGPTAAGRPAGTNRVRKTARPARGRAPQKATVRLRQRSSRRARERRL